ncbi:MAG TPA: DUF1361 domain-containing protein [Thermoanaerobaculia bacterium]
MHYKRTLALGLLVAWCIALLFLRIARSGSLAYTFLVWNLFLALAPAVAAMVLARTRTVWLQLALAALWLAFLPNAPYIVTDLLHLRARPPVPLWFDVALLVSFATTGLLLGYISLSDVQRVAAKRFGQLTSWLGAVFVLFLSGFGIYLGRFLRWNSWQVVTEPMALLADIARRVVDPFAHPRTLAVTAVYGCGLVVGYVVFRMLFVYHSPTHE